MKFVYADITTNLPNNNNDEISKNYDRRNNENFLGTIFKCYDELKKNKCKKCTTINSITFRY